jgi:hypothetical protein
MLKMTKIAQKPDLYPSDSETNRNLEGVFEPKVGFRLNLG